jgi:uncharacterized repeat protein (TIGR01451 family)
MGLVLLTCLLAAAPAAAQMATGTYTGNSAASRTIEGLGFQPDVVIIKADQNQAAVIRTSLMPDGMSKLLARDDEYSPDYIGSFTADGFMVSDNNHVNQNSWRYDWVAFVQDPGRMDLGTYNGNSNDDREIDIGYRPDYVIVIPDNNHQGLQRSSAMPDDFCLPFDNQGSYNNGIQSFTDLGFVVGNHDRINDSSVSYDFIAWRAEPVYAQVGIHAGNGTDDWPITAPDFKPGWVLVKQDGGEDGVHRSSSLASLGDSFYFGDNDNDPDRIQSMLDTGFEVGTDKDVNENGKDYYWAAFGIIHDLDLTQVANRTTAMVGDSIVYTITVSNPGPGRLAGATIYDMLPIELEYISHTESTGSYDPLGGTWKFSALAAGDSAVLEITAGVLQGSAGRAVINAATISEFTDNDPDLINNSAYTAVTILRSADLQLGGGTSEPYPEVDDIVTITVGAQNRGPDAATAVIVSGALPAGLEYVTHFASIGSYDPISGDWTINTLGAMNAVFLQLDVRVLPEAAGRTLTYTPSITSEVADPVPVNNSVVISMHVPGVDLAVGKMVDDPSPNQGAQILYTIAVRNEGTDPTESAVIRDLLPTGLEYVSYQASQGTYEPLSGDWDLGVMESGGMASLEITVNVTTEETGLITNTVTVLSTVPIDPDTSDNTASVDIDVQGLDVRLTGQVDDDGPDVGQTVTFNITAENTSPEEATGLIVHDRLPVGLTYVNSVPSRGIYNPATGNWDIGNLAADASCVLQLTATVDAGTGGTTLVNTAAIINQGQFDHQMDNNQVQIPLTVRAADLNLIKNVDDPTPVQGAQVDFTLLLTNEGPDDAFAVTVADTLPSGLVYVSSSADQGSYDPVTGLWGVGDVTAGDTVILTITATVQLDVGSGDSAVNTAWIIASDQEDPDLTDNQDDAVLTQQSADLVVGKTVDDGTPAAGDTVVYTVTLHNDGPSAAGSVAVLDSLPTGTAYVSHEPPLADYNSVTGLWSLGTLAIDEADTLHITALIGDGASGNTLVNEAVLVSSDQADPDGTNNAAQAELTVRAADLSVHLILDDPTPTVGDTVRIDVALGSDGPDTADATIVVDLPAVLELLGWSASDGVYAGETGEWSLSGIASGAGELLTFTTRVLPGTIGSTQLVLAGVGESTPGDPDDSDNADSESLTVRGADLVLEKAVNLATPFEGETVLYTLTLRNDGPHDVADARVSDLLPTGLTYVSHTPSWVDYDPVTGLWTAGAVAAHQTATLFLQAVVSAADPGDVIVNTATVVFSDLADPDLGNNQDGATITIPSSDLSVGIAVDDPQPGQGDPVVLTLSVDNVGPDTATGVVLLQDLPEELIFSSSMPGGYDPASGRWFVGELVSGGHAELHVFAGVDASAIGDTLTVTVEVDEVDQDDPMPGDETAAVQLFVQPDADLSVSLSLDAQSANVGDRIVWTVDLVNQGPNIATGVTLRDTLPAGVAFIGWETDSGVYDPETATWTIDTLAPAEPVDLELTVDVLPGYGGLDLFGSATILGADQSDRDPGDNRAVASLHVLGAGLGLVSFVDVTTPNEGDDVNFTLSVTNLGPDAATGVTLIDSIPEGLTYVSHTPPTETYTQGTGGVWTWDVGQVESQSPRVLFVRTRVEPGTTGQALRHAARVVAGNEEDPQADDNLAVNLVAVEGVDLAVTMSVDDGKPAEGDTLRYRLEVANNGPNTATGVALHDSLGMGLTLIAVEPDDDFDWSTGVWTVGDLSADDVSGIDLTVLVEERTGGTSLLHHACVEELDQVDPVPENDSAQVSVDVDLPAAGHVLAATSDLSDGAVEPLSLDVDILALELVNWSVVPDTLESLTLYNQTDGPGTRQELDASWSQLTLWRYEHGNRALIAKVDTPFDGGSVTIDDLGLQLVPGDTLRLVAGGAASATARDGDTFALSVNGSTDLVYNREVTTDAAWPLITESSHPVDAFTAAQALVDDVDAGVVAPGGTNYLALAVDLPGDGYAAHTLTQLAVVNTGTARPVTEISAVHAWVDDGDGHFSTIFDEPLGEMAWTGDRWMLAGLSRVIAVGGARVMISVDAAPSAEGLRSVQLAIPIDGVTTDGGADGPTDVPLVNAFAQVVSSTDRLWVSSATLPWRSVHADGSESLLLHLTATNTFDVPKTLTGLRVTGTVTSSYSEDQAVLDAVVSQFLLRNDADQDGSYTGADQVDVLGATSLIDGSAVFRGLDWTVPPTTTRHLFVTARLSGGLAADGDNVAASVGSAVDVQFDGNAELAGNWPLGSGGLVVDGMLAAAVGAAPVPSRTVGPGEGPVLALDLVVPRNGHADDVLKSVTVENRGTAAGYDLAELRLYRDGGNGAFDAGVGADPDDSDLGILSRRGDLWMTEALEAPVGEGGARLFVGITGAADLTDSTTVLLALPADGLQYASDNDGPLDVGIVPGGTLLLSRAPLQISLWADPDEVIAGQALTVRMSVRNSGIVTASNVAPSVLIPTGDGGLLLSDGPTPASVDLNPGKIDTFTWTYVAETVGSVVLTGTAAGETAGGAPLISLPIATGPILVVAPPPSLVLSPLSQLPFAVNGGQTDVSALTLDIVHPGDAGSAAVQLEGIIVGLEDALGDPVQGGGLLTRIKMRADGVLIHTLVVDSGHGSFLDLVPDEDLVLQPGTHSVITIDVDIATGAAGVEFRLAIEQAGLSATDVVAGSDVEIILSEGDYPVLSELTRVVDGASTLMVTAGAAGADEASQGQTDVRLGGLDAANPGVAELDAGVQLGVVAVSLYDADVQPLADASAVFSGLSIRVDGDQIAWLDIAPGQTQPFILPLGTPVSIDAGQTVALDVRGDLRGDAPLGAYRLVVVDAEAWDVRDANSGVPISVITDPAPLVAAPVDVVVPATLVHLGGHASGLPFLTEGAQEQPVLSIDLRHPAEAGTAPVAVDTLRLRCVDGMGAALPTESFMSRIAIRSGGETVGAVLANANADGTVAIPLTGAVVAPANVLSLEVIVDLRSDSGVEAFAMTLDIAGVHAVDVHLHTPVTVTPDAGVVVPLSTGLRSIRAASDKLIVAVEDLMPAAISSVGGETPVMRLDLSNPAPANAGNLAVDRITLRASVPGKSLTALGDLCGELTAYVDGELWGTSGSLTRSDSTAVILPQTPLLLRPDDSEALEIRMVLAEEPAATAVSLGLTLDDISARQPEGDLIEVQVLPAPGQVFPFWTQAGTVSAASLEESYSNFPNPFAAGRALTTFVFALDGAATVDLRLYTPRGELVRTLLAGVDYGAGLHQDATWDGRNGRGDAVRNGVYIAELSVRKADGSSQSVRRKVAVVR